MLLWFIIYVMQEKGNSVWHSKLLESRVSHSKHVLGVQWDNFKGGYLPWGTSHCTNLYIYIDCWIRLNVSIRGYSNIVSHCTTLPKIMLPHCTLLILCICRYNKHKIQVYIFNTKITPLYSWKCCVYNAQKNFMNTPNTFFSSYQRKHALVCGFETYKIE